MYGAVVIAAAILLTATVSSRVLAQGVNSASGNTTTTPNQVTYLVLQGLYLLEIQ